MKFITIKNAVKTILGDAAAGRYQVVGFQRQQKAAESPRIPETPDPDADLVTFFQTPTKAMKFNDSFGFVRMYLSKTEQS